MAEFVVPLRKETKDSLTPVAYKLKLPPTMKCHNESHQPVKTSRLLFR